VEQDPLAPLVPRVHRVVLAGRGALALLVPQVTREVLVIRVPREQLVGRAPLDQQGQQEVLDHPAQQVPQVP